MGGGLVSLSLSLWAWAVDGGMGVGLDGSVGMGGDAQIFLHGWQGFGGCVGGGSVAVLGFNPMFCKRMIFFWVLFCTRLMCQALNGRYKTLAFCQDCTSCSPTTIFLLRKLSCVNIFLRATVHARNATLEGAFTRQLLFHGKA